VQRYILNMGVTAGNNNPAKRFAYNTEITREFSGRPISPKTQAMCRMLPFNVKGLAIREDWARG